MIDQEPTRPLAQVRGDAKQQAAVVGNERLTAREKIEHYLIDQEPTRPLAQVRSDAKQQAPVVGNERLIAREKIEHYLIDQEPTRLLAQVRSDTKQQAPVAGNERLTALVGTVLLVLIVVEIIIAAKLQALIPIHIFVGVLLTVPLFVKIGSTGYRFLHYYTGSPAFVQKGPPRLEMRLLAPLLLLSSLSLVASGILLTLLGPTNVWSVWVLRLHALSVLCWLPLLALHVRAYIWRVPRLLLADWQKRAIRRVPGRGWRYGGTFVAFLAGVSAAALFLPLTPSWIAWEPNIDAHIPGPLLVALFAAFLVGLGGLMLFKPWRWRQ